MITFLRTQTADDGQLIRVLCQLRLGPPLIQSKMQCRRRFGSVANWPASAGNQPLMLKPPTPIPAVRNQSRRWMLPMMKILICCGGAAR